MRKRILTVISIIAMVVAAAGPGQAASEAEEEAIEAAREWLALVDAGKYEDSWKEAAGLFKNAVTKIQWDQAMRSGRNPLGAVKTRRVESSQFFTTLPGAPDGEYVVIKFASSFANKQAATETVTPMLDDDGVWRVSGYFIK